MPGNEHTKKMPAYNPAEWTEKDGEKKKIPRSMGERGKFRYDVTSL